MFRRFAVTALVLMAAQTGFAFDVSPTTPVAPAVSARTMAAVAPELATALVADRTLADGVDAAVLGMDGRSLDSLRGTLSEPLKGDLEPAVRGFLTRHARLFNIDTTRGRDDLSLVRSFDAGKATQFTYQMKVGGVPVRDAYLQVSVDRNRVVQLVSGAFPTVAGIENAASMQGDRAADLAVKAVKARGALRVAPKSDLVVVPGKRSGRLAYQVRFGANEPLGDWDLLIDAENGRELARFNQMAFAEGRGSVYVNHPLISSVTVEVLPSLASTSLVGDYCEVENEDEPGSVSETHEHIYDPANTHFDEANIYYLVNKAHDHHKALGFDKLDFPLRAVVHLGTNYDNAYYSPWENLIAFGDGNRFNDLAKEEAVCWHEYAHAVLGQIVSTNYSAESGAMNEGQADYFACSLSDDPKVGEYACAKMGKPYLRTVENNLQYPKDITNEVHADGRIWGAVLWDLRKALGAQITDKLIQDGFLYLKPGSPKFIDGYNTLMTADKNLFEGTHQAEITKVFQARGIVKAVDAATLGTREIRALAAFRQAHGEE